MKLEGKKVPKMHYLRYKNMYYQYLSAKDWINFEVHTLLLDMPSESVGENLAHFI